MTTPRYPSLYQINTRVWLTDLSAALGRKATLDDIPDADLDRLARLGFDWVWLLSVWRTGEAAQRISRSNPEWRHEFEETLPDLREEDIGGSGFAITGYTVHPELGGDEALARLRRRLRDRGLRLMLDFVPNHTAPDHPWVEEHPDYYVAGTEADLAQAPQNYTRVEQRRRRSRSGLRPRPVFLGVAGHAAARLRNSGHSGGDVWRAPQDRRAMRWRALRHGDAGPPRRLRADVGSARAALLAGHHPACPRAGARVLLHGGGVLGPRMDHAAAGVRLRLRQAPVRLLARRLRQAGAGAPARRPRLPGPAGPFPGEPRRAASRRDVCAGATRPRRSSRSSHPGLRFFHQGQFEGRKKRISPHLVRAPVEQPDDALRQFYDRLLSVLRRPDLRDGSWRQLECAPAWDGNWTWDGFLACTWQGASDERLVVAVNYAGNQAQCYVRMPFADLSGRTVHLRDLMSPAVYDRAGDDLLANGLYLDLPPWGCHVFLMTST